MGDDIAQYFRDAGSIAAYTVLAVVLSLILFEVLNWRFHLMREIFHENSVAAGIFGAAFVFGVFYTVAQIVVS